MAPNNSVNSCLHFLACLCFCGLAACSGSGSGSDNAGARPTQSEVLNDSEDLVVAEDQTDLFISEEQTAEPIQPDIATSRVSFNVTVPAYQSNALQVRLIWGSTEINANWVIDELWSMTTDLPTNSENQLIVVFSDQNGELILGRAEAAFSTGNTPIQTVEITADQFDTSRWDDDNDGIANLDELLSGSDPLPVNTTMSADVSSVLPQPFQANLDFIADKTFRFSWEASEAAEFYRVLEDPTGSSGYSPISDDLDSVSQLFDHRVALYNRVSARYIIQACNDSGCTDSDEMIVTGGLNSAIGQLTTSNGEEGFGGPGGSVAISADGNTLAASGTGGTHVFVRENEGWQLESLLGSGSISLSADGDTLAIGRQSEGCSFFSPVEDINGNPITDCTQSPNSGAVYIFVRTGEGWQQQAHIISPTGAFRHNFGHSVSISTDGNTLAIGTLRDNNVAGAVYVFTRNDGFWQEQATLRASNAEGEICNSELPSCYRWGDAFGTSISLSGDGNLLAVGAPGEDSATTEINGDQFDNTSRGTGAVYLFLRTDESWQQQTYIKPNYNNNHPAQFGNTVALNTSGSTLAVGASGDDSTASGINTDQATYDSPGHSSGAVYIFERIDSRIDSNWQQQAHVKASNTDRGDEFARDIGLSSDGNTLAVSTYNEDSAATGINGDQNDNSAEYAGAVYVFRRTAGNWQQQAYVKSTNTERSDVFHESDRFGWSISLSADGESLAVADHLQSIFLY